MCRWPVLVVVWGLCACGGTRVEAGLANAPRLGGDTPDRSGDVVVKMPTKTETRSHPVASSWLLPGSPGVEGQSLVVPWLDHFYVDWPCARAERTAPAASVTPIACTSR